MVITMCFGSHLALSSGNGCGSRSEVKDEDEVKEDPDEEQPGLSHLHSLSRHPLSFTQCYIQVVEKRTLL